MTQLNDHDLMPGSADPDFARMVREYLSHFSYYRVEKNLAVRQELYQWCRDHLGEQYRDWFIHEGGQKDKWWTVNIRSPKKATFFALRWMDIIIDSVDRRKG